MLGRVGTFVVLLGFWFFLQFQRYTVAAFLGASTFMADLGIAAGAAGLLSAVYFPAYGLMQVGGGIVADRGRSRLLMLLSGPALFLACVLLAVAPDFWVAVAARFAAGLASGGVMLAILQIGSARLGPGGYGRLAGPMIGFGMIANLLTALVMPLVLGVVDWRLASVLAALPLLPFALLVLLLPEAGRRPSETVHPPTGPAMRAIVGDPQFQALLLILIAWEGLEFGVLSWLPRYSAEVLGLPKEQTGVLSALVLLGAATGSSLTAVVAGRSPRTRRRWLVGSGVGLGIFAAALALTGPTLRDSVALGIGLAFVLGVALGHFPIIYVLLDEIMPRELIGTAMGALNALAFLTGAFAFPALIGVVMDLIDRPTIADWTYSPAAYAGGFAMTAGLLAVCTILAGLPLLAQRRSADRPDALTAAAYAERRRGTAE